MSDRNSSPQEIEARIHERQEDLREDLEALKEKTSPEHLTEQAKAEARHRLEGLKDDAARGTHRAGEMVREKTDEAAAGLRRRFSLTSLSFFGLLALLGAGFVLMRASRGRSQGSHPRTSYEAETQPALPDPYREERWGH